MTPTEKVLSEAKKFVAAGFVKDREFYSAETKSGKLTNFASPKAARFSPPAAIFLAEMQLIKPRKERSLNSGAIEALQKAGYAKMAYMNAESIDSILELFDAALKFVHEANRKEKAEFKREQTLAEDDRRRS